ncbi:hypothetical protein DK842_05560 [Chromobacterium phragmitis]|nr:hypothetical protein DK842_05560 [Chromobacterium phragmitis]
MLIHLHTARRYVKSERLSAGASRRREHDAYRIFPIDVVTLPRMGAQQSHVAFLRLETQPQNPILYLELPPCCHRCRKIDPRLSLVGQIERMGIGPIDSRLRSLLPLDSTR